MSSSPSQRRKYCFLPAKKPPESSSAKSDKKMVKQEPANDNVGSSSKPVNRKGERFAEPEPLGEESDGGGAGGGSAGAGAGADRRNDRGMVFTSSSSSVELIRGGNGTDTTSRYYHSSCNKVTKATLSHHLSHKEYCKQQQQQLQQIADDPSGGDSAKINCKLNEIFIKRLREIDCSAEGDADLKLVTYQEWIEMLLKINETIINNMQELESEVSERLECVQQKADKSRNVCNELAKSRRDICALLKVIHNGYHNNNWDIKDIKFETIRPIDVLGSKDQKDSPRRESVDAAAAAAQRNKLQASIKALAVEVADRHDEVCDLKRQIFCLEDEILNAQKKIQLKDDVIRELRNDLKCANAQKLSEKGSTSTTTLKYDPMPPINYECATARSAGTQVSEGLSSQHQFLNFAMAAIDDGGNCSPFESLAHNEQVEQQRLRILEDELNDLFEMTKDLKKQNYEFHRKRLSDIFQKSESEKAEAYRKLDFIRTQLADLEVKHSEPYSTACPECDSGFSSKSENDKDVKIVEGVRKRIRKLTETMFDLKKRVQQLEIENNELSSNLETEKTFVARNSETLKQVADLLCNITGDQFSYSDIYNATTQRNPFCEVIVKMENKRLQREKQLCKRIEILEECMYEKEQELKELERRGGDAGLARNNVVTTTTRTTTTKNTFLREDCQRDQQQQK